MQFVETVGCEKVTIYQIAPGVVKLIVLAAAYDKIKTIKLVREFSDLGLLETKEIVDRLVVGEYRDAGKLIEVRVATAMHDVSF